MVYMEGLKLPLVFGFITLLVLSSGCTTTPPATEVNGTLQISDGSVIPQDVCAQKGIAGKVLVFHSLGCPACRQAVPVLEEIANETGRDIEFLELTQDSERIEELSMMPDYIPAVVIDCKVYVGYKSKDEFLRLMGG